MEQQRQTDSDPRPRIAWYQSLKTRILATLISVLVVTLGITLTIAVQKQPQLILKQARQQAYSMAHAILPGLKTLMLTGEATYASDWLQRMRSHSELAGVEILRRNGSEAFHDLETLRQVNAFLGSEMFSREASRPFAPKDLPAADLRRAAGGTPVTIDRGNSLTFLLPIHKGEACNACHGYDASPVRGILRVDVSVAEAIAQAGFVRKVVTASGAALILLLSLFIWLLLQRRVLTPVARMTEAASTIAGGDFTARLDTSSGDEIARLAHAFNGMAEALRQTTVSRDYVEQIIRSLGDMLFVADDDGRITLANPAAARILGYSQEELKGMKIERLFGDGPPPAGDTDTGSVEHQFISKQGEKIPVLPNITTLEAAGRRQQVIFAARDITKQKAAERELRLAAKVMDTVPNAILVADADATIRMVNPAFCRITGYTPEEVIGQNPRILQSGRQTKDFYREMWDAILNHGHWEGEIWNRRKNGEIYPQWLSINTMRNENGEIAYFVSTFMDITERKRILDELEHMANHDILTGLPNRKLFINQLDHAMRLARRNDVMVGLLFIDIDGFKPVNDSFGHDVGDELLKAIAHRLQQCVRDSDTIARIGGDEFTLIMENVQQLDHVTAVAEKILAAMSEPFVIGEHECRIGASIGISLYPDDSRDLDDLIKKADTAMYLAKSYGRNRICIYSRKAVEEAPLH